MRAILLCCLVAWVTPVGAQDQVDSAEWRQQAAAKIEQGETWYREGRYYQAADAFGWVAKVDLWYGHAGPRQIMALVRAGLADTGSTEALTTAARAFRTLKGFPLPDNLQAEYEAIERILEERANQPEPVEGAPTEAPVTRIEPTPTPVPEPEQVAQTTDDEPDTTQPMIQEQPAESLSPDLPRNEVVEEPPEAPPDSASSSLASDDLVSEPEPQALQPAESVTEGIEQEHEVQEGSSAPAEVPADQSRPQVAPGDIISLAEVTTPPRLKRSEPPVCPLKAQQRRVSGDVKLLALVGVDGSVERLNFVSVPRESYGFEKAVKDVIGNWLFEPATKDGIVVRTWVPIRIPFSDR